MTKVQQFIQIIRKSTDEELQALLAQALQGSDEASEIISSAIESEVAYRSFKASK